MACLGRGVDFSTTCTLGQQHLFCDRGDVLAAAALAEDIDLRHRLESLPPTALARFRAAPDMLAAMGATLVDTVDISDFEGANLLADLNQPIPESWHESYSLVLDGGVTEHLANPAQCLLNAAAMVRVEGHLISITPANDQAGHGLYQFGPEFYYRLLFDSGEFVPVGVLICVQGVRDRWYSVADPAALGQRITFSTAGPTDWYVCARRVRGGGGGGGGGGATEAYTSSADRTADVPAPVPATAQQSDYRAAWDAATSGDSSGPAVAARASASGPLHAVRRHLAGWRARSIGILGLPSMQPGVESVDLAQWGRS
jgi:hypothetical protein